MPVQKETTQQGDTLNKNVEESDIHFPETSISEMSPAESDGLYCKEQSDMEEPVIECLQESKESSLTDQEHFTATDPNEHVYIESEPVALEGTKPHDTKVEIESVQKQAAEINDENILTDDTALVNRNHEDLIDSSERTSNTLDNSEVSIHVTTPNKDALSDVKDSVNRPEDTGSEDLIQENSSTIHSVLTSETSTETEVDDMGETAELNANDGSETKFTSDSSVDTFLILHTTNAEDNTDVVYKDLLEQTELELEQCSPRFDGNQAVITQKEFFSVTGEVIVSAELQKSCPDNKQHDQELLTEMVSTTECTKDKGEMHVDEHSVGETLSSNVEKMNGQDLQAASEPGTNVDQAEAVDKEAPVECSLDEALVVQRVDAGKEV